MHNTPLLKAGKAVTEWEGGIKRENNSLNKERRSEYRMEMWGKERRKKRVKVYE